MKSDNPKPKSDDTQTTAPASPKRETVANNLTGRVTHDDRGNAIWEWAVASGAFGTDPATQRMRKLGDASLSLTEDAPPASDTVKKNPLGTVKGYSPYDSGLLEKKAAPRKRDLRKLSEWLKLQKQAGDKPDGEESP